MEITGKLIEIGAIQQVTDSMKKREFVLEYITNPQYPEYVKFEALQDKCSLLDSFKVGDTAEVFFNLCGRPWTDKTGKKAYFNSLKLWKITKGSTSNTPEYRAPADISSAPDDDSDLPFS